MTHQYVEDIIEFNQRVLGIQQRELGMMPEAESDITIKCLNEEAEEFQMAYDNLDFIGTIDALIDSIYFAVGAMYKQGLDARQISQCMDAVHQANMEKKLGVNHHRGDGSAADAVKPEGWVSPEERIAEILGDGR